MPDKEGQASPAPRAQAGIQVGSVDLGGMFLLHHHDLSSAGGGALYGPYFIRDVADGNLYKLQSTNGKLGLVKV